MENIELTDEELAIRDERIREELLVVINYKRDLARQMRQDAAELEKEAHRIEQRVSAEKWYELEGYLEPADIESLCNVSPTALLTVAS
jgi:hypothetical protein